MIEIIFAWPGMGTMILNSINNRDYAVIQGVVVMAAGIFVIINMLVDIDTTASNINIKKRIGKILFLTIFDTFHNNEYLDHLSLFLTKHSHI